MFDSYTKTLDGLAKHDNLFAVYVGNEVVREGEQSHYNSEKGLIMGNRFWHTI